MYNFRDSASATITNTIGNKEAKDNQKHQTVNSSKDGVENSINRRKFPDEVNIMLQLTASNTSSRGFTIVVVCRSHITNKERNSSEYQNQASTHQKANSIENIEYRGAFCTSEFVLNSSENHQDDKNNDRYENK